MRSQNSSVSLVTGLGQSGNLSSISSMDVSGVLPASCLEAKRPGTQLTSSACIAEVMNAWSCTSVLPHGTVASHTILLLDGVSSLALAGPVTTPSTTQRLFFCLQVPANRILVFVRDALCSVILCLFVQGSGMNAGLLRTEQCCSLDRRGCKV